MTKMENDRMLYVAPTAQRLEIRVERGFTISPPGGEIETASLNYDPVYDDPE